MTSEELHALKPWTGGRYKVVYRITGVQRYDRYSIMTYLRTDTKSMARSGTSLLFSARPVSGTQELDLAWIKSMVEVPPETPHAINKRA